MSKKWKYRLLNIFHYLLPVLGAAAGIFFIVLGLRLAVNLAFVAGSKKEVYFENAERFVSGIEMVDPYAVDYNIGIARAAAGDHAAAIVQYEKALEKGVLGGKKAMACINMSISRTKTVDLDGIHKEFAAFKNGEEINVEALVEKIFSAISVLTDAREDLSENGCIEGKDADMTIPEEYMADAKLLDHDIYDEIELLKRMLLELGVQSGEGDDGDQGGNGNDGDDDENEDDSNGSEGESEREKKLRKKLEKQQRDALEEQNKAKEEYKEYKGRSGNGNDGNEGEGGNEGDKRPW